MLHKFLGITTVDITNRWRMIGPMQKNSEYTIAHRRSKIAEGYARVDGLLVPQAASEARRMVEEGEASCMIHAVNLALLAKSQAHS